MSEVHEVFVSRKRMLEVFLRILLAGSVGRNIAKQIDAVLDDLATQVSDVDEHLNENPGYWAKPGYERVTLAKLAMSRLDKDGFADLMSQALERRDFGEAMAIARASGGPAAQVPADPDGYELTLPEDFEHPDPGNPLEINPDDPRLPAAREFAHRHNLTQAQFRELLALDAAA